MAFTDDDLWRLKERMKEADVPASHVKLLLARLKAAEAVCQSVIEQNEEINFPLSMQAWRRAAGKNE